MTRIGRLLPPVFFLVVAAAVFRGAATSLAAQGAASGTPITNAAMYPRLIAALLAAMSLGLIAGELRAPAAAEPRLPIRAVAQAIAGTTAFVIYLILLPVLGYLVTTPILVAGLLVIFGMRAPLGIAGYSLALALGCAIVFQGGFNVTLPRGQFGLAIAF